MVVVDNNDVPHIVHAPGDIVHGAVVEVALGCMVAGHNLVCQRPWRESRMQKVVFVEIDPTARVSYILRQ